MRKFIFTSFLAAYLLAFFAPFAMAADTVAMKFCEVSYPYSKDSVLAEAVTDAEVEGDAPPTVDTETKRLLIENWYASHYVMTTSECGEENSVTKSLEKGDCSKGGNLITELSEFTPDSNTSLGEDSGNFVMTVYAGSCCLVGMTETGSTTPAVCDEDRIIYKTTYSECTAVAGNCSKRTWVISTSGANLLKLSIKYIYGWAVGIVGLIAVTIIIYNGIKISISGISGDVSEAKNKIFQAIGSIVLLFLSGLILYTINPTFFS